MDGAPPIRAILDCCAPAAIGLATIVPPTNVMKSRRFNGLHSICCPSQGLRGIIPD